MTYQLPGVERNYHIFYWLLSGEYKDYAGQFKLQMCEFSDQILSVTEKLFEAKEQDSCLLEGSGDKPPANCSGSVRGFVAR